ncbi:MAG: hypothetical protein R3E01_12875 [Pirellulaceae bacterium]|nr:hypothetical protein [Planctomycetales bacterium]
MTPLFKKLNLADNGTILVLNPPESFEAELAELSGVTVRRRSTTKPTSFAIGFATSQAELTRVATELVSSTSGDAIVWIAYPKKTSKRFKCEFNRDSGDWSVLGNAGFEPVRQVAIDADWSALRFRRTEYIQALTRQNSMAISEEGKRRTK